jgi:hypothetical protein
MLDQAIKSALNPSVGATSTPGQLSAAAGLSRTSQGDQHIGIDAVG